MGTSTARARRELASPARPQPAPLPNAPAWRRWAQCCRGRTPATLRCSTGKTRESWHPHCRLHPCPGPCLGSPGRGHPFPRGVREGICSSAGGCLVLLRAQLIPAPGSLPAVTVRPDRCQPGLAQAGQELPGRYPGATRLRGPGQAGTGQVRKQACGGLRARPQRVNRQFPLLTAGEGGCYRRGKERGAGEIKRQQRWHRLLNPGV